MKFPTSHLHFCTCCNQFSIRCGWNLSFIYLCIQSKSRPQLVVLLFILLLLFSHSCILPLSFSLLNLKFLSSFFLAYLIHNKFEKIYFSTFSLTSVFIPFVNKINWRGIPTLFRIIFKYLKY